MYEESITSASTWIPNFRHGQNSIICFHTNHWSGSFIPSRPMLVHTRGLCSRDGGSPFPRICDAAVNRQRMTEQTSIFQPDFFFQKLLQKKYRFRKTLHICHHTFHVKKKNHFGLQIFSPDVGFGSRKFGFSR